MPIAGQPADVVALLDNAHAALRESTYPKMLFVGEPGALVSPEFAKRFVSTLHNCEIVQLGAGAHYLQEDHPLAIAAGVRRLMDGATPR
jgi:haloalkane dehalogenase